MGSKPLMTIKDLSVYTKLSIRSLERMVAAKEIPSIRIGPRTRRFRPEDIERWLEKRGT